MAGYQGQGAILTGALRHLAGQLQDSGWGWPVDCKDDVTAAQEKAAALLNSVEPGELGFVPVTTAVKEVVRLVQSGEVQVQENPLTKLLNFGLWRHYPHASLTLHFFGVLLLACSHTRYDRLAPLQWQTLSEAQRQRLPHDL